MQNDIVVLDNKVIHRDMPYITSYSTAESNSNLLLAQHLIFEHKFIFWYLPKINVYGNVRKEWLLTYKIT